MKILDYIRKHPAILILLVLIMALAVRIIYVNQLKENPFFNHPIVDSQEYHKIALRVANGESPGQDAFYQPPFYPYLLGFLYKVVGTDYFMVRFLQMMLGVLNVFLLYLLALRFMKRYQATACSAIMALYGTMLFFEGELLAPVLIVTLNLLLMLVLVCFNKSPSWWRAILAGVLLGLSAIAMAVVLPFALVILIYWYFLFKKSENPLPLKTFVTVALCFGLGIVVVILPVTAYNMNRSGEFILISSNAGINFYLGTGRDFQKKVDIRPGFKWKELMREPIEAGFRSPSQQSGYFLNKSFKLMKDDPLGYAWGTLKKLFLFANGNEIMRNQEIYPFRHYSPLLSVLLWKKGVAFPFGLLFPLAVMGIIFSLLRKQREHDLLILFSVSHILVIVFFFISARYRLNILPFLVILAVYGAGMLLKEIKRFRSEFTVKAASPLAVFLVLLVICNVGSGPMAAQFNADAYFNLGRIYMEQGKPEARAMFEAAIRIDPEYPDANGNLGILLDIEGDYNGAVKCFNRVLAKYPQDIEALSQLSTTYYHMGNLSRAKALLVKVLELDKDNENARNNIAILNRKLEQQQQTKMAELSGKIENLKLRLKDEPKNINLLINLGMSYIMKREFADALPVLLKAVELAPNLPQAHNNLGVAWMQLGKKEEARKEFEIALKLAPGYESPKKNLEILNQK